jgi:chemotaxis protein histidine kinase CheA
MARNAIDHGIEDEIERVAAGKDNTGTIQFKFFKEKDKYKVSVGDDGRGLNFDSIRKTAVKKGLLPEKDEYTKQEILRVLFSPNFSTKESADTISGRGVGLDVVMEEVKNLGGAISVVTQDANGTRFTISLPEKGELS